MTLEKSVKELLVKSKEREVLLDTLCRELGKTEERNDIVKILRGFEEEGMGKFIIGRRGQKSRFEKNSSLLPLIPFVPNEAIVPQKNSNTASIKYPLRSDFMVNIELPADLSEKEADRLCNLIKLLIHGGE